VEPTFSVILLSGIRAKYNGFLKLNAVVFSHFNKQLQHTGGVGVVKQLAPPAKKPYRNA